MELRAGSNGHAISRDLNATLIDIARLKPLGRETRRHPRDQLDKLASCLDRFGFVAPIVVDLDRRVIAGSALVQAARRLGLTQVPAVTVKDLDEPRLRALRLALNRLGEYASWDADALRLEFSEILKLDGEIDLQITGFEMGKIDSIPGDADDIEDELPAIDEATPPKSLPTDIWILGDHQISCANSLDPLSFKLLMGRERAQLVFTDPPFNVPIAGHVCGAAKHREFRMGSGEMSSAEFERFLATALGHATNYSADGAIHYVCMDWRHIPELLSATANLYTELKNVCVWNKSNAGMGSLYRSKHELVFVFKKGRGPHINNVELGRFGRHRSNVWDYPSQNTWSNSAKGKLDLHPTVKPVALVADAIRDCSNLNDIVLDPFGGSGTTLIAAEKTGRRARLIEIEPRYVDVTVRRWQRLTGRIAVHAVTGLPFGTTEPSEDTEGMGSTDGEVCNER
jgi:DNA modification methylase